MRLTRRHAVGLAAAVALGLLAGCGGLPVSGGVHIERTVPALADPVDPDVRALPPPPLDGAGPVDIVRGFLGAQSDDADGYAIARSYLAGTSQWDPTRSLTVYGTVDVTAAQPARRSPRTSQPPRTSAPTPAAEGARVVVRLQATRTGRLDSRGTYTPLDGVLRQNLVLQVVRGQWRIVRVPNGLLLTVADLQRSFRPLTLWWLAPGAGPIRLVPEVRWLPTPRGAIATALVRALLDGPSAQLAPGVITAVPPSASLQGSATLTGSDVLVDLTQPASTVQRDRAELFDQLARTLQQVPTAVGVRLTVNGQPLPLPGIPSRVDLATADAADPDTAVAPADAVALVAGKLTRIGVTSADQPSRSVNVPEGSDLSTPAVSLDGTRTALLRRLPDGRQQVVVAAGGTPARVVVPAGIYTSLSWSLDGTLAVGTPRGLLLLAPTGSTRTVTPDAVASKAINALGPVDSVRLARDGVRVAITAGAPGHRHLMVGTLTSDGARTQLTQVGDLTPSLGDVEAAGWSSSSQLTVLARPTPTAGVQLGQLASDGSGLSLVALQPALPAAPTGLAVAAGSPVLVSAGGSVYERSGDGWRRLGPGSDPAYPG